MARIRSTKPEFWSDGAVIDLSPQARLLFLGSWNFAMCDNGHVADDARRLKNQVLPEDDVMMVRDEAGEWVLLPLDAGHLVEEIVASGRMTRVEVEGRTFLHIKRFTEHQKLEKRWSPRCPACKALSEPLETSLNLSETPATTPQEGKGGDRTGGGNGDADASPRRNTPADEPRRLDVERLCNLLADEIESNGSKRPSITQKWRDSARLMLDRDGRTEEKVAIAIRWCQADEFWRSNILSMPKLREKYDQLRMAAQRARAPAGGGGDIDWEAAMARAAARDASNGAST